MKCLENYGERGGLPVADSAPQVEKTKTVEVGINQQQYVIIERLRAEKQFGIADGEIIRKIFQEFVKQEGH
jgi:hypothetical protein